MIKVKPCPFCGKRISIRKIRIYYSLVHHCLNFNSITVGTIHLIDTNKIKLIRVWNRRIK